MTVNPTETTAAQRWPGWPGDNVFRMIVPVDKVGNIIGKGGEIIKTICDETGARVRIMEGPLGNSDRVVLIAAKEEPETDVSPAMDAVFRVFKRISGISSDGKTTTEPGVCSIRLLMASSQAFHLIGKQGASFMFIHQERGAIIHVITGDERAYYASEDERIVYIQGEPLNVLTALEAVVGHIRKFLVDHSMLPLFEKSLKSTTQDRSLDTWSNQKQSLHSLPQTGISHEYSLPLRSDSLFVDRERHREHQLLHSDLSPLRHDHALSVSQLSGLGRPASRLVTKVTQKMQIPLAYAVDIIGSYLHKLAYIRGISGAAVSVGEGDGINEAVVEISGTPTQVHTAQRLVEEAMANHNQLPGVIAVSRYLDHHSLDRQTLLILRHLLHRRLMVAR